MSEQLESARLGDESAGAWGHLVAAQTKPERAIAAKRALQLVSIPESTKPVARFFLDLPWVLDTSIIVDSILENLIYADDIYKATTTEGAKGPDDILDVSFTIHSVHCLPSDVKDAKWGAYLLFDIETRDGEHIPVSTSASEVCVAAWRAYCQDLFPCLGMFTLLGTPVAGRNQPVGLRLLRPLVER